MVLVVLVTAVLATGRASAWDRIGHEIVTRLAVAGLPTDVPGWVASTEVVDRLAYLSAEPDRWRGTRLGPMAHWNNPDHYLDVELLEPYGLTLQTLPRYRYDFVGRLAVARSKEPARFAHESTGDDPDQVHLTPGMLPYRMIEMYAQLRSSWSTLKTFEKHATLAGPAAIASARERVVQTMGIMSHYVGDAAQPLHTTRHFNGWVGDNPRGYTTDKRFHQFIDGSVIDLHDVSWDRLRPRARPALRIAEAGVWEACLEHIDRSYRLVEPLYQLEHDGELRRERGRVFIEDRILDGGAMLAGLWASAYETARIDDYIERGLLGARRDAAAAAASAPAGEPRAGKVID